MTELVTPEMVDAATRIIIENQDDYEVDVPSNQTAREILEAAAPLIAEVVKERCATFVEGPPGVFDDNEEMARLRRHNRAVASSMRENLDVTKGE